MKLLCRYKYKTGNSSEEIFQQLVYLDEERSRMVDVILRDSDLNNDGYNDYAQFKQTENK